MKLLTYNILGEDDSKIQDVLAAIKLINPDFLAIQEANFFTENDNRYMKEFSETLGLPYYDISLGGEDTYHVASFSRYPFKETNKLSGFTNACIETVIEVESGDISICNAHLSPYNENKRFEEIRKVIEVQSRYDKKIILGDINSLSPDDGYSSAIFNDSQKKKFMKDGQMEFRVVSQIKNAGYTDIMVEAGINQQKTVPTPVNKDEQHGDMRLDYIFVSRTLVKHLKMVEVVKNELTDKASDHYPVVAELTDLGK